MERVTNPYSDAEVKEYMVQLIEAIEIATSVANFSLQTEDQFLSLQDRDNPLAFNWMLYPIYSPRAQNVLEQFENELYTKLSTMSLGNRQQSDNVVHAESNILQRSVAADLRFYYPIPYPTID